MSYPAQPAPTPAPAAPRPAWYDKYPSATLSPNWISREKVKSRLESSEEQGVQELLLVDLRRVDHEGGTIKTSLNLPAQSFYHSIPTLYSLCIAAGIKAVVFYCGSSTGRGSRAASWFQEYINKSSSDTSSLVSYALEGGIRGWVEAGEEYIGLMSEYDREYWEAGGGKNCAK